MHVQTHPRHDWRHRGHTVPAKVILTFADTDSVTHHIDIGSEKRGYAMTVSFTRDDLIEMLNQIDERQRGRIAALQRQRDRRAP